MRHAIISEFKRIGYDSSRIKDELLAWNIRCEKPLSISEQKRQLTGYVDWFDNKDCRTGCKALENYCLGKDKCEFNKQMNYTRTRQTQDLPFDIRELEKFMQIRFKASGIIMLSIVKTLRRIQIEKATGEIIYVGFRKIASLIRDNEGSRLEPMEISRKMNLLISEGIIEKAVKGKSGNFRKIANGYRFLAWSPP